MSLRPPPSRPTRSRSRSRSETTFVPDSQPPSPKPLPPDSLERPRAPSRPTGATHTSSSSSRESLRRIERDGVDENPRLEPLSTLRATQAAPSITTSTSLSDLGAAAETTKPRIDERPTLDHPSLGPDEKPEPARSRLVDDADETPKPDRDGPASSTSTTSASRSSRVLTASVDLDEKPKPTLRFVDPVRHRSRVNDKRSPNRRRSRAPEWEESVKREVKTEQDGEDAPIVTDLSRFTRARSVSAVSDLGLKQEEGRQASDFDSKPDLDRQRECLSEGAIREARARARRDEEARVRDEEDAWVRDEEDAWVRDEEDAWVRDEVLNREFGGGGPDGLEEEDEVTPEFDDPLDPSASRRHDYEALFLPEDDDAADRNGRVDDDDDRDGEVGYGDEDDEAEPVRGLSPFIGSPTPESVDGNDDNASEYDPSPRPRKKVRVPVASLVKKGKRKEPRKVKERRKEKRSSSTNEPVPDVAPDFFASLGLEAPPRPAPSGIKQRLHNQIAPQTAGLHDEHRIVPIPPRRPSVPPSPSELGAPSGSAETPSQPSSPRPSPANIPLDDLEDYDDDQLGPEESAPPEELVLDVQPPEAPTRAGTIRKWRDQTIMPLTGQGARSSREVPPAYSWRAYEKDVDDLISLATRLDLPNVRPRRLSLPRDIDEYRELLSYRPREDKMDELKLEMLDEGHLGSAQATHAEPCRCPQWWPAQRDPLGTRLEALRRKGIGMAELCDVLRDVYEFDDVEVDRERILRSMYERNWLWAEQIFQFARIKQARQRLATPATVAALNSALQAQLDALNVRVKALVGQIEQYGSQPSYYGRANGWNSEKLSLERKRAELKDDVQDLVGRLNARMLDG
ncbi:hypothetical protein JCM10212_005552 [Sporobolomyces blumeae]